MTQEIMYNNYSMQNNLELQQLCQNKGILTYGTIYVCKRSGDKRYMRMNSGQILNRQVSEMFDINTAIMNHIALKQLRDRKTLESLALNSAAWVIYNYWNFRSECVAQWDGRQ
ncbi:hypothetical protein OTU49_004716 [Cherax quadricarinatus]|uniref:Uncharacterized protein n=1 Tax=Cherax quadricarinatus TaxID=27406 RepID=A0AAW0XB07_CHEQU